MMATWIGWPGHPGTNNESIVLYYAILRSLESATSAYTILCHTVVYFTILYSGHPGTDKESGRVLSERRASCWPGRLYIYIYIYICIYIQRERERERE